jgi:hypothetical protein
VRDSGRCYSGISTDYGDDFPGTTVAVASSPGSTPADVPPQLVQACAAVWRAGILQLNQSQVGGAPAGTYPVPPLVACVLPSGQAAVFPGQPDTCDGLGLAPLEP